MKKFLTSKWLILIVVSIGLVVFNSLVFNVSVVNRNIVVGIGLDYEDEEYILYTQVVLPKNGGVASGGGNNYITLKAKAKNIDIAVSTQNHSTKETNKILNAIAIVLLFMIHISAFVAVQNIRVICKKDIIIHTSMLRKFVAPSNSLIVLNTDIRLNA